MRFTTGSFLLASVVTTLAVPALDAAMPAHAAQTAPASSSYWAVVAGDNVMLRSGPSVQSAYPFGRLMSGQPLKVAETQYGWARVQAVGPTFDKLYGFVKVDAASRYDASAKSLTILGKVPLLAPNMDANMAPDKSWRQLTALAEGDTLQVIEEVKGERDAYYSVRLPAKAEGWVNLQYIQPVSQAEADAFEQALRGGTAFPSSGAVVTAPPAPTPTPAPAPAATPATAQANQEGQPTPTTAPAPTATEQVTNNPPSEQLEATAGGEPPAPSPTPEELEARQREEEAQQRRMEAQLRRVTYQDLESIWSQVRNEPTETAELATLRDRYEALAEDEVTPYATRASARARASQIQMRVEVQDQIRALEDAKARLGERKQGIADLDLAMKKRMPYDSVGRLMASTVYNGDRLPLLYKLTEPTTGHTLAYVVPSESSKPSEALGLVVGIKGKRRYDETLRVNLISPEMIDVLETKTTAVVEP